MQQSVLTVQKSRWLFQNWASTRVLTLQTLKRFLFKLRIRICIRGDKVKAIVFAKDNFPAYKQL